MEDGDLNEDNSTPYEESESDYAEGDEREWHYGDDSYVGVYDDYLSAYNVDSSDDETEGIDEDSFKSEAAAEAESQNVGLSYFDRQYKSSAISFGGAGHCMEWHCGCRSYEGTFGAVCTNCHHGHHKHF